MKTSITTKFFLLSVCFFIFLFANAVNAGQANMYYKGYLNSWGSAVMTNISGVWKTTVQAGSGSGSTGFKIANTTDWSGSDWSTGGAISLNTIVNFSLGGANTLITETGNRYYTFTIADNDTTNANGAVLETENAPVTITNVQQSSDLFCDTGVRINITVSSSFSSGETVYIRYTNDNWSTSAVVGMKGGSGTNWWTDIPKQKSGYTIQYYAATSTVSLTDFQSNADLVTINLNNNGGSNYSYTQDYMRITGSLVGGWSSEDSVARYVSGWPNDCYYRVVKVSNSADSSFKFIKGTAANDWRYQWGGTGSADADSAVLKNSIIPITYSDGVTRDKLLLNGVTAGYYYTCKLDTATNKATVLETANSPVSITNVSTAGIIGGNETATINITLSGTKSAQEKILLVYTSDNWANTYSIEAAVAGVNCSAVIPGFSVGTIIKYFAISTTVDTLTYDIHSSYSEKTLFTLSGNNNSGFYYTYTVVNTSIPVISYNSSAKPAGSYFNSTGLNLSLRFVDSSGLKDIWWNINQTDSSVDRRYLVTNSSSTDTTAIFNYPAAGDTLNWSLLAELSLHTLRFWVSNDGNAASDSYEFAFYKDVTNPVITLNDDSYTIKSDTVYFIGKSFNVDFSDNAGLDTIYINFNSNTEVLHSGGVSSFTENWNIPASIYHSLSRNANNRINLTAIDYAGNSSNSYINIRCETMILDGLTTDWQADEVIDTDLSEGDNVVFYFSWDDTAFYAGVDNIQLYSGVDNQHIIWLGFDATCNGSGGDSFTNPLDQAGRARFTGAFKPDYCFRFRNNLANEWEQSFVRWTGTGWDWTNAGDTVRTYLSWDASHKFTEIIIPRSIFGGNLLPSDKLGLCMWVVDPTGDGNNGWTWATLPVSNTEGASALQSDSIYFSSLYDTVSPLAPNIAPTVTIDTPVNCDTGGTVRFKWNFSDANPGNAQQYVNIEFCTTSVFTYPFASYSAATISTSYDSDLGNYRGEVYWRVKVSDGRDWSLWTAGTDSFIMTASINGNVEWNGLKHDTTALVPGQSYNYLFADSVYTTQSCTVVLRSYKNDLTGVVCRVWWDAEYKYKLSKQFSSGNYDYWTAVLPGRGDTGNIDYRFECGDGGNTVYVSGNTKAGYTGNSINYGNWIVGDDQNNLNDFKYEITTLPKVIVSSPATENNGCDTSSTTVTVAGTNTAGCSVYLYLNGSLKTSDVDGNTNWSLSVSGLNANETNTISVLQYNPSVSIYSETSKIYVFCDTAGPVPSIISVMDMIDSTPAIDFPDFTDSFSIVLYEILLDTYSNFSNPDSYLSVSSNLTIPDTGWLTTEVWYIKVRAKDSLGNWGSYSNADSFAITLEDNQAPVITVNDDSYTVKSLNAALYGKLINIDFADNTGVETVYMSTGTNTETVLNSIGANYTTDWQIGSSIFQYLIRGNNKIYITAQDNYSNYSNAVINIAVETIAVSNGSISDFQSDELLETRLSNSFYFTWDDTSLYLGYAGPDGDLATADFFVYLQVSTASQSDSNRTTIDWGSYGTHTLPFGANYVLCAEDGDWAINRFQKNINGIWTEIGSSVNAEIFGGYTSNKTTKFRISWSSIGGKPEWMKVLAIHQHDGESKIHNSYPTGNPASGLTSVALTDYYYFNNLIDTVSPQTGKMINAEHNQNQNISGYNNNTMPYIYPYPVITHNDNVVLRVLTNKQSGGAANAYYTTDGSNPTTSSSNISLAWEADTGLVNSDVWAGYISPKSPGLTVKYFFKITQDTKTTTYLGSNGRKTSESEILPFSYTIQTQDTPTIVSPVNNNETAYVSVSSLTVTGINKTGDSVYIMLNNSVVNTDTDGNDTWAYTFSFTLKNNTIKVGNGINTGLIYVMYDTDIPTITLNDSYYTMKSNSVKIDVDFADSSSLIKTIKYRAGSNWFIVFQGPASTYTADWFINQGFGNLTNNVENQIEIRCEDYAGNYASAYITVKKEELLIDGSLTDWQSDELIETRNSKGFYLTWDDTNLYVGYSNALLTGEGSADVFVYVSTSNPTPASTNTTIDWAGYGTHTLPVKSQFIFCFENGTMAAGGFEFQAFNGTVWQQQTYANMELYGGWSENQTTEYRIGWDRLNGKPDTMAVVVIHQWETGKNIFNSFPKQNPATNADVSTTLTNYYYYPNLNETTSPNYAKYYKYNVSVTPSSFLANETFTVTYTAKDGFDRTITNVSDSINITLNPYIQLSKSIGSITNSSSGSMQAYILSGDPGIYTSTVRSITDNLIYGETSVRLSGDVFTVSTSGKSSGSGYDSYIWNLTLNCEATSGLDTCFWLLDTTVTQGNANYLFQNSSDTLKQIAFNLTSDSWNNISGSGQHYIIFYVYNDSGTLKTLTYNFYKGISKPYITVNDDSYVFHSNQTDMGNIIDIDFYDTTSKITDAWITNNSGADTKYIFSNVSYPYYSTNWGIPSGFGFSTGANKIYVYVKNENGIVSDSASLNIYYDVIDVLSGNLSEFLEKNLIECNATNTHKLYFDWDNSYFYFGFKGLDTSTDSIFIIFDNTPGSASGANCLISPYYNLRFTGAFLPEAAVAFRGFNGKLLLDKLDANLNLAGTINIDTCSYYAGTTESLLRIPKSIITSGVSQNNIGIAVVFNNSTSSYVWRTFPTTNSIGDLSASSPLTITDFYVFNDLTDTNIFTSSTDLLLTQISSEIISTNPEKIKFTAKNGKGETLTGYNGTLSFGSSTGSVNPSAITLYKGEYTATLYFTATGGITLTYSEPKQSGFDSIDSSIALTIAQSFNPSGKTSWANDAVIYNVLVPQFVDGEKSNNTMGQTGGIASAGGDLQGVIKKIKENYFQNLGVNCLYLSPIYPCNEPDTSLQDNSGWLGFDPVDLFDVRKGVGGWTAMTELLNVAHKNNIKVILDHPAYWSWNHPKFKNLDGSFNDYYISRGWFDIHLSNGQYYNNYESFGLLPTNHQNGELNAYLLEQAKYWSDKGLDGMRFDVATFFGERDADGFDPPGFWGWFNTELKKHNPEFLTIGEVILWNDGPWSSRWYVSKGRLDGAFAHTLTDLQGSGDKENHGAIKRYFMRKWTNGTDFLFGNGVNVGTSDNKQYLFGAKTLEDACVSSYTQDGTEFGNAKMVYWLTNHDRSRFLTDCFSINSADGVGTFRGAMTFGWAWTQIPMLYNGDEIGMYGTGSGSPSYDEGGQRASYEDFLKNYYSESIGGNINKMYKMMGFLRRYYKSLRTGSIEYLYNGEYSEPMAFVRKGTSGETNVLYVWNNSASDPKTINVSVGSFAANGDILQNAFLSNDASYVDTTSYTVAGGVVNLTLQPHQAMLLIHKGHKPIISNAALRIKRGGIGFSEAYVQVKSSSCDTFYMMTDANGYVNFSYFFEDTYIVAVSKDSYNTTYYNVYLKQGDTPALEDSVFNNTQPNKPVLTSPINNQNIDYNNYTMQWTFSDPDAGDRQKQILIQIDTNPAMTSVKYETTIVTYAAQYSTPFTLNDDETYCWRIKVWDSFDSSSEWSDTGIFYVRKFIASINLDGKFVWGEWPANSVLPAYGLTKPDDFRIIWDANYIYIGMNKGAAFENDSVYIYIDTDYASTNNGINIAESINGVQHNLPFNADYVLIYHTNSSANAVTLKRWNGSWTAAGFTGAGARYVSGGGIEIRIPKTDLGNPSKLRILFTAVNGTTNWLWAVSPNSNNITYSDGSGISAINLTSYFEYDDINSIVEWNSKIFTRNTQSIAASADTVILPFTPVIDATKDPGWGDTPFLDGSNIGKNPGGITGDDGKSLDKGLCRDLYITNDVNNLYIGWEAVGDHFFRDVDGSEKSANFGFILFTDTYPDGISHDPWGSDNSEGKRTTRVINYSPDFWINGWVSYGNDDFGGFYLFGKNGTNWNSGTALVSGTDYKVSVNGKWGELKIPLNSLGINVGDKIGIIFFGRHQEKNYGINDISPYYFESAGYPVSDWASTLAVIDATKAKFYQIQEHTMTTVSHIPNIEPVSGQGLMRQPTVIYGNNTITAVLKTINLGSGTPLKLIYSTDNWITQNSITLTASYISGNEKYYQAIIPALNKICSVKYYFEIESSIKNYIYGTDDLSYSTTNQNTAKTNAFSFNILNSIPSVPTIILNPELPKNSDKLSASGYGSTDGDSDLLSYIFEWYKNNVLTFTETDSVSPYNSEIASDSTNENEIWYCKLTVKDSNSGYSNAVASRVVKITDRWKAQAPNTVNSAVLTDSEWIWFDKSNDERTITAQSSNYDINEIRLKLDVSNLYFRMSFRDVTNNNYPNISICFDTDLISGSGNSIIGDDGRTNIGNKYGNYKPSWEKQLIIHNYLYDSPVIEWTDGTNWGILNASELSIDTVSNVVELAIDRNLLGLGNAGSFIISIAVFKNQLGLASEINSTVDLAGYDAIDNIAISGLGNNNNDKNNNYTAAQEDLEDGANDFWIKISYNANGFTANNAPAIPSPVSPQPDSVVQIFNSLEFKWNVAVDADANDNVVSYLFELATDTSFSGSSVLYRVNLQSDSLTYILSESLNSLTNYYYRIRSRDSRGVLSDSNVIHFQTAGVPVLTVSQPRDINNVDNYSRSQGNQAVEKNINFSWAPAFHSAGWVIKDYVIQISTNQDFNTASILITDTIYGNNSGCTTYYTIKISDYSKISRGKTFYARIKAGDTAALQNWSEWSSPSDGIYLTLKRIDGNILDWSSDTAGVWGNNKSYYIGDTYYEAVWSDSVNDQRTDKSPQYQFLDIKHFHISADKYNMYFKLKVAALSSDHQLYLQIPISLNDNSSNRYFVGTNVTAEDVLTSQAAAWNYMAVAVTNSDNGYVKVLNTEYSQIGLGVLKKNVSDNSIEFAVPLEYLGGINTITSNSVKFTPALFWGNNDAVGQWNPGTPNAVDSIDNNPLCWWEVGNQVIEYYLNVSFDSNNFVASITGETTPYTSNPPSGSGYPPFSARSYIFYNVFVDRFWDGYANNKPMDSSMTGGDFDGLIQKLQYFNEHAITGLYMSPIFDFGGGAWGYNQHDLYKVQGSFVRENWNKFKGWDDFVRLAKEARRRNIRIGVDWVPGQIYGNESSGGTIQKNPKMHFGDRFGGRRILQYLANVRQFYVDHAHHLWGLGANFFRVDNPKFYPDPLVQGLPFFVYTRNYCDKFAPDLYTFGEVPGDAGECAAFCADGTRLHGMLDFPFAYPTKSWAAGGSSTTFKSTLEGLAATYGKALMTGFYNNHDNSRTYHDIGGDWTGAYYKSDYAPGNMQTLMLLLAAHVGPPVIFYGDERVMSGGKEVTYPGFEHTGSTGEMGVTRQFPWWEYDWYKHKNNPGATGAIDGTVKMAMMAREIMWWMHYDNSSRALYDNDGALIYSRFGDGREVICIINNSDGDKWVHGVPHQGTYYRDWFTLDEYTPGTGNFDVLVPSNYARFLVKDGFTLGTLSVNIKDQSGNIIENAIVSVGNKSCWTRSSGSNGNCIIDRIYIEGWEGYHEYNVKVFKQGYKIYNVVWKFYPWQTVSGDIILEPDDGIPPSAPTGLRGIARGKGCDLYWTANTESDFESYYIYRSTSPAAPNKSDYTIETLNPTYMDSNLDDGLELGKTYYYWVRARDINNNVSEPSNMITVIPHKVKVTFQVDMSSSGLANIENIYIKSNTYELGRNDFNEGYKLPDIDPLNELTHIGNGIYEITAELDPTMTINYIFVCKYDGGKWYDEYSFRTFTFENARELKIIDSPDWTQKVVKKWMVWADAAPQAPKNLSAIGKNKSIKLGWSLNKEADIDHYEIWKSSDGTDFYWVTNANNDIINYIDNNVSNGLKYYYKLKAVDKSDNISDFSDAANGIPTELSDDTPPSKPKNMKAQGNGIGTVLLSWDYNSEGDFAGYNVYRDTAPDFTIVSNKKLNGALISPSFNPVYEDKTAVPGLRYYYRISALDDALNESEGSDSITVKLARLTFKLDIGALNPVNVQFVSNIPFIGWNPGAQMSFDTSATYKFITDLVVGEQIYYKYGYNNRDIAERDFTTVSKNRELIVPDVLEKTYSDDWQEQPQKCEGFTILPGNKSAYLYWNKNTVDQDLAGYNVYLQKSDGSDSKVNSSVITSAFYKIENLTNGTKYYYFVRPLDSGDLKLEGPNSDVKEVIPKNTVPVIFKN